MDESRSLVGIMRIHYCAQSGDIEGVKEELARGVSIDAVDLEEGYTPLMYAVTSPMAGLDMVRFLLDEGADVSRRSGHFEKIPVIGLAAKAGNIEKVRLLIEAKAKVNYKPVYGDDILSHAVSGYATSHDDNLPALVRFLIDRGAKVKGRRNYALRSASMSGRFDVVRVLLDSGANIKELRWTELMQAVVLGTVDEVKNAIHKGADLTARDHWARTPWLLSVHVGDVEKAGLLLSAGVNREDKGRWGIPVLAYAVESGSLDMVRWLLDNRFDVEVANDFGETPLMVAAERGATECIKLLLEHGARTDRVNHVHERAISVASNLDIVRLLVNAGEDLNDISTEMRRALTGVGENRQLCISHEEYHAGKRRRFGTHNPELMDIAFWKAMVQTGVPAYRARETFNDTRDLHQPVWCFDRFGKSITELPDGKVIEIAGEHEDFYDADFCIYNDVVVHHGNGTFTIFGYPAEVFAPTDFHSATLVGDHIYIIGCLGYPQDRRPGETPVYRLDCRTFEIQRVETSGQKPGWLSRHRARLRDASQIHVTGGKIDHGEDGYVRNSGTYVLDLRDMRWTRLNEGR